MNHPGREWDADADPGAEEPDPWFRPVWTDLEDETAPPFSPLRLSVPPSPRPSAANQDPEAAGNLLGPLAAAQDALARLDAAADMLAPALREGLIARLAYAEAAGLLAARGGHAHPIDLALRDTERLGRHELWLRGRPPRPADDAAAWLETTETVHGTLHLARLLRHLPVSEDPLATAQAAQVRLGPLGPGAAAFDAGRFDRWQMAHWPMPQRGVTPSPPPQRGVTSSPPPQRGVTSSPPPQRGVTSSPPPQRGVTSSPAPQRPPPSPPPQRLTPSPPPQRRLTRNPAPQRGITKSPPLLRAADAAAAWMEAGIADVPDAAQALAVAALLLRRTGTLHIIPLPVWAGWTALCTPQDPNALPRLRGDVAARLAPDGAPWPLVFLHLVAEAARAGWRILAGLRQAEATGAALVAGQDRRSRLPDALALLLRHPALTAPALARHLAITPQAALRILGQFVAAGMVIEITGRKSFRAFAMMGGQFPGRPGPGEARVGGARVGAS